MCPSYFLGVNFLQAFEKLPRGSKTKLIPHTSLRPVDTTVSRNARELLFSYSEYVTDYQKQSLETHCSG